MGGSREEIMRRDWLKLKTIGSEASRLDESGVFEGWKEGYCEIGGDKELRQVGPLR